MSKLQSAQKFLASEEAKLIREDLMKMVADPCFNTESSYTTSSSDSLLFVDKHMRYMSKYANVDPQQYLSNLKLMTRIKP